MNSIEEYLKSVRAELEFVTWPTQRMVVTYSVMVIAVSLAAAMYLGVVDFSLKEIIAKVVAK